MTRRDASRVESIVQRIAPSRRCDAHVKQASATYPCAPATCSRSAVVLLAQRSGSSRTFLGAFCRQHARSLHGYRVGPDALSRRFHLGGAR